MRASPPPPTPQTRTRIRDNQRRSRARKKEYIHQLEAQVRAAEQRGVQASVEVQTAARRVVEENRRLRELLRYHGVSERSIEGHLAAGGRGDGRGVVRNLGELLNPVEGGNSEGRSCACTSGLVSPRGSVPTIEGLSTGRLSRVPSPKPVTEGGKNNDNNNCSMAADLISTMTGANPHDVRTSLGCTPGTECHVDDARIGDAIEHLTGPGE
ncbi:hypothetical protein B0J18DRAFT_45349 [Chaetomium sp. MPI-SDFR-AT-0129]|nr:hypothetical protein B0J18DRAFT_45349 [Chaetomium sp. MPI-SDFR-AT-0129]